MRRRRARARSVAVAPTGAAGREEEANVDSLRAGAGLAALCLWLDPGAALAASKSSDAELAAVKAQLSSTQDELAATRAQLAVTQSALSRLASKVDALETAGAPATPAPAPSGPRIPPVNADNPAISFVVDTTLSTDTEDLGWNFALRSGELFMSAPVDPFVRAFATINGSSTEGFDIEEAAIVTTSLPWNLTVKGGRFFADVGRMPHWHDEALPFVNRPPSIDRMFGGETQAEGAEVTWLAPTEHFIQVNAGLYNTIGADRDRQLREEGFHGYRAFDELTWLVHPNTYFDLTDTLNLEAGGTFFTVADHNQRQLYGADLTLRHQPGTSSAYQGFVLGTEWYWNNERFANVPVGFDPATGVELLGNHRFMRNGGYAYLETFWNRRYSFGVRADFAEDVEGAARSQRTYSAFATWMPSEFHRLRLQFDEITGSVNDNQQVTLQWTAFMGSHSHGFAMR